MSGEQLGFTEAAQARLDTYLDAIEDVLAKTDLPRSTRRGITDDVETQIHEMLSECTEGEVTEQALEKVLGKLDPPEAYAEAGQARSQAEDAAPVEPRRQVAAPATREPARMSRPAVIGAIWASATSLAVFMYLFVSTTHTTIYQPPFAERVLLPAFGFAMLLIGGTAIIGTTLLGLVSISQIRHSAGRVCGLPLAVFDSLFFPLLAIDGLILFLTQRFMLMLARVKLRSTQLPIYNLTSEEWNWVWAVSLTLIFIVDLLIIWRVWRAASKPVA